MRIELYLSYRWIGLGLATLLAAACGGGEGASPDAAIPTPDGPPPPCAEGTFDHDGDPATACEPWTDCPPGQYVADEGSPTADRRCAGCASGTFSAAANAPSCDTWASCAAGTHVANEPSATTDRVCEPCADGTYTSGDNQATCLPHDACSAGTIQTAAGTATTPPTCEACTEGTYCAGGAAPAVACAAGSWDHDVDPATTCAAHTACVPGESVTADGTTTTDRVCEPCAAGSFSAGSNAHACTEWTTCEPGTYVASTPSVTNDRGCSACPDGTYSDTANVSVCTPWTACPVEQEVSPGTSTRDRVCAPIAWTRQFGTAYADEVSGVSVASDGTIAVAGRTAGALAGHVSAGSDDAFVQRYALDGTLLWSRQFGNSSSNSAWAVRVADDGNIVIAGGTIDGLPGQISFGWQDAFISVYDASGTIVWSRQFGTSSSDVAYAVDVAASGTIVVAGGTKGALPLQSSSGLEDAFVRAYDPAGGILWTRQFGSPDLDRATSVGVGPDGTVVVAGYAFGTLPGQIGVGGADAFVRAYDATGVVQWTRQFGSSSTDRVNGVSVAPDGTVVVAGDTRGALPGKVQVSSDDCFVRAYRGDGTVLWTDQFGRSGGHCQALAVTVDDEGTIVVAGASYGSWEHHGAFVRAYDPAGTPLWTQQVGGTAWGVDLAPDRTIVIGGYASGALPGQSSAGGQDAFVMRLLAP